MRDAVGDVSLRRRLGLGAWLALGALLALGVVQTSLVVAQPAAVSTAADASQTQVANAATAPAVVANPSVAVQACDYPDDCSPDEPVDDTEDETVEEESNELPDDRDCTVESVSESTTAPFIRADDDCGDERATLTTAGCSMNETIGIGDDTLSTSDDAVVAALAAAPKGTNVAIYQLWNCGAGETVTLTTNLADA